MKSRLLPPSYFWGSVVLGIMLHFFVPIARIISSPYRYIGVLAVALGVVINLWTDSLFKSAGTPVQPYQKPTALLNSGPFHISRHPMYLGMTSVLIGVACICGSVSPFFVPVLFVILMQWIFIRVEEKDMESVFGEQYMEYKKRVRKWI